jgi:oligosaccharide repeat unit polymerase
MLQRSLFVMAALIFIVVALLLPSRASGVLLETSRAGSPGQATRPVVPTLIVLSLAAVAILLPLQLRNVRGGNATGLASLFQYLLSGILGLGARDQQHPFWTPPPAYGAVGVGPAPGYGSYTFRGLFRVLDQLGVPVPVAPTFYDYYPVAVGDVSYWTNTGTSILDFRLDFGIVGVCVAFLVLSFTATVLQRQQPRNRLYALPITAYLLVTLFWSFFGNSLLNDFKYFLSALFGCYILSRLVEVTPTEQIGPVPASVSK